MAAAAFSCRACRAFDCADCSRWTDRHSACQHRCDVQPHQLSLFSGEAGATLLPAADPPEAGQEAAGLPGR